MATLSLRLDAKEEKLFRNYAKLHNMTISELLRTSAIERIEDEIDLSSFDTAMAAMTKTYSLAEAKKELGLDK